MSDIIGFYNREDKPAWREFFDRRTKLWLCKQCKKEMSNEGTGRN